MLFVFHSQTHRESEWERERLNECRLTIYLFLAGSHSDTFSRSLFLLHCVRASSNYCKRVRSGAVHFGRAPTRGQHLLQFSFSFLLGNRNGNRLCRRVVWSLATFNVQWQPAVCVHKHKTQGISIYGRCLKQIKLCRKSPRPTHLQLPFPFV